MARSFLVMSALALTTVNPTHAESKHPASPPVPQPAPTVAAVPSASAKPAKEVSPKADRPHIEVCFVLDTTGSMSGLIKGAKMKIWAITNEMAAAKPTPDIRIGLIGYRDRKDAYVTQKFDLTEDLDAIYGHLMKFKAGGGGDTPESVNQALHEAVTQMSWSKNRDTLKVIFLVGDAPPHMDYKDDVKHPETCKLAIKKDLIINTIQCGTMGATTPVWQQIARNAEGSFVQIAQSGNMVAIATPFDKELAKLNGDISRTVIRYGNLNQQREVASKVAAAESADAPASADRLSVLSKSGGKAVTGRGDLVADEADGSVKLEKLNKEQLPDELKNLSADERKKYLAKKSAERKAIQIRIAALVKKRDAYIKAELAKRSKDKKKDAFDTKVAETIREQAKRKNIKY